MRIAVITLCGIALLMAAQPSFAQGVLPSGSSEANFAIMKAQEEKRQQKIKEEKKKEEDEKAAAAKKAAAEKAAAEKKAADEAAAKKR